MTRAQEPAGGWPWNRPGYTFSIGWPVGYVPQLADQMLAEQPAQRLAKLSTQTREEQMRAGTGWGSGTMGPLSNKSDPTRNAALGRELLQRQTAQARGLTRYFTGLPCVAGHRGERYTSSGACVECMADLKARRAAANPATAEPAAPKTYAGAPCKRGHDGLRYVSDGQCVHCRREKNGAAKRAAEVPA